MKELPLALFTPGSIAIVGATETPGPAANIQRTLEASGFPGRIIPVNPNRPTVFDRPCFPSIGAVPEKVDLSIILVRPDHVVRAVQDSADAGVAATIIYSAGFAELSEAGRVAQAEITSIGMRSGMRIFGPNCVGFVNPPDRVASLVVPPQSIPDGLRAGSAALVSQSGGLLISVLEYSAQLGLGYRLLVSTGNQADVTVLDAVQALLSAPDVRCIGLISEGIDDGRRLVDLAGKARSLDKTIVALKLGRSVGGAKAALTHTAALAGSQRVFDAACIASGIPQVTTIAGLVDHLILLEKPRPRRTGGSGIAVLTISGGTKILVADLAADYGLPLARLSTNTQQRLAARIPAIGTADNPLDVTAAAIEDSAVMGDCVRILAADAGVTAIALVMHLRKHGGSPSHQRLVRAFCAAQAEVPVRLAVVSSIPEGIGGFWKEDATSGDVPFLNDLASLAALRALEDSPLSVSADASPLAAPPPAIRDAFDAGWATLGEVECRSLFESAGIAIPRGGIADTSPDAVRIAGELGYPVVMKLAAPALAHKTELGAVRLDLQDPDGVVGAYAHLVAIREAAPDLDGAVVLVEEMIPSGHELLVSVSSDAQFGSIVTVAMGGVFAEAIDDVAIGLAPVKLDEALAMLSRLHGIRVLEGWRGRAPAALAEAARVIVALSELGAALAPWVHSLEINPLIVTTDQAVAADGLGVLETARGSRAG
jgi:acyl-CoA synthetase (NDP forming)